MPIDKAARENALREVVLEQIGTPDDLKTVSVHELWDCNHYRVNVYREITYGDVRITDSYFVTCTEQDEILSDPPMICKYNPELTRYTLSLDY